VDSDQEIEQRCGVRIPVIFDFEGEHGFRAREEHAIGELVRLEAIVLATGGGAVLSAENRRQLASRGTTIYLHARPEDLYRRLRHDKNRPLLDTPNPAQRLRELYVQRDPLYRQVADIVLETGAQSVQALARELLTKIEEKCKVSA
jgi:shikimate kinase